MINRRARYAVLLSFFSLFTSISTSNAEQAILTDDLKDLHIPVIKFNDRFVWARFEHQVNSTDPITFVVKEYGTLPERLVAPKLHDISEVTDDLSPAIVDITHNQARLSFISTIPLACSIVYGKTKAFGSISTDANMNGAAIINHNPLLTDLDPNTLYYYRVQGADAEGKLYWSPYGNFTTAATLTQNSIPATLNLLSLGNGATVTAVSSHYGNAQNDQTWAVNKTIDGARAAWSSNGDDYKRLD